MKKFKVAISYPPLKSPHGVPLLGQNRQFQWFHNPTYIYPMVPAYAATLLSKDGYDVLWDDAIAGEKSHVEWLEGLKRARPLLIAMETKTPVIERHWEIIRALKAVGNGYTPLVALMGDHVTAEPEESMQNSPVDFVLTGGDYDALLLNLCRNLSEDGVLNPGGLAPGIWYREGAAIRNTGPFKLDLDIESLPDIDRELTGWRLYSNRNGNFKRLPGTYTMAGRDCWWGKCTFCSWTSLYTRYRVRRPESLLDEIGSLIERYGIREIMDDTGTFPAGQWLRAFAGGMIERGYSKKISFDCNMRFGALKEEDYRLLKKAGFRLLLFGLESANQSTLDRLDKGIKVEEITESLRLARGAGLFPHITVMFGYPWESYAEALNTIRFARELLKKGLAWTVQATVVIPYPGTPLHEYCGKNGFLSTASWKEYDMRSPVIKTSYSEAASSEMVRKLYSAAFSPEFIIRRLLSMRDADDLRYMFRAANKVFGHLADF